MTRSFLATATAPPPVTRPETIRGITLESLDGLQRIPLDGTQGWWRLDGATGLEMAPVDVVTAASPGVAGSVLQEVRAATRPIFIPIYTKSMVGHVDHLAMMDRLRDLVDPLSGEFHLVASTPRGERQLRVVYVEGLEGAGGRSETGVHWKKMGLSLLACQPYAQAREDRSLEFRVAEAGGFLIGAVGGTDAPWPTALSSTTVIGSGMQVNVGGELPVYPTVTLTGPMTSFRGTMAALPSGAVWDVNIPAGVPSGSTLRIVTDPRARSIRLDGALAAGSVARGSSLRAFMPGTNTLNVTAPGGTSATSIVISWREQYRSLW